MALKNLNLKNIKLKPWLVKKTKTSTSLHTLIRWLLYKTRDSSIVKNELESNWLKIIQPRYSKKIF